MLLICRGCSTRFAVGLPRCPYCTSTDAVWEGEEEDTMAKITVHGGPSNAAEEPSQEVRLDPPPASAKDETLAPAPGPRGQGRLSEPGTEPAASGRSRARGTSSSNGSSNGSSSSAASSRRRRPGRTGGK